MTARTVRVVVRRPSSRSVSVSFGGHRDRRTNGLASTSSPATTSASSTPVPGCATCPPWAWRCSAMSGCPSGAVWRPSTSPASTTAPPPPLARPGMGPPRRRHSTAATTRCRSSCAPTSPVRAARGLLSSAAVDSHAATRSPVPLRMRCSTCLRTPGRPRCTTYGAGATIAPGHGAASMELRYAEGTASPDSAPTSQDGAWRPKPSKLTVRVRFPSPAPLRCRGTPFHDVP